MSRIEKIMWRKQRFRTAGEANDFAASMFDIGYTMIMDSFTISNDDLKFYGFTWGETQEGEKIIIFTPSHDVFVNWRASEVK